MVQWNQGSEMNELQITESIKLTTAEQNTVDTQHLARHVKGCFVAMGGLLKENQLNVYWAESG